MKYKGFIIKPYAVICNGYKYAIKERDGFTHITSAKNLKEAKEAINNILEERKNQRIS